MYVNETALKSYDASLNKGLTSVNGAADFAILMRRLVGRMADNPIAIQADTILASFFFAGREAGG